jgi:hypothetical protein
MIVVPFFWEGILFAFLIDVLYGGIKPFSELVSPAAVISLAVLIALLPLHQRIRSYD